MRQVRILARELVESLPPKVRALAGGASDRRLAALKASTMLTRQLTVEALEPRLLLSGDIAPIAGKIDVPGETDSYTFTLTQPKKVLFDAQTGKRRRSVDRSCQAELVADRPRRAGRALAPVQRQRRIQAARAERARPADRRVSAERGRAWAMRRAPMASACSTWRWPRRLPRDDDHRRHDAQRSTNLYRFDATAGDRLFLDSSDHDRLDADLAPAGAGWRTGLRRAGMADRDAVSLGRAGTYTLAIEGDIDQGASSYSFAVHRITDQEATFRSASW
jgi:hypothetical protein